MLVSRCQTAFSRFQRENGKKQERAVWQRESIKALVAIIQGMVASYQKYVCIMQVWCQTWDPKGLRVPLYNYV